MNLGRSPIQTPAFSAGACRSAPACAARDGQLDRAHGDNSVVPAHLHHSAQLAPERRNLTVSPTSTGPEDRTFRIARRSTSASSRSSRSISPCCFAANCSARWRASRASSSRLFHLGRLQLLDRPIDLRARVEEIAPRVLPGSRSAIRSRSRTLRSRFATSAIRLRASSRTAAVSRSRVLSVSSRARAVRSARQRLVRAAAAVPPRGRRRRRAAEATRDRDAVRTSRNALDQLVRGRERDRVELQRRVDDAADLRCELLESSRCVVATVIVPRDVRALEIAQPSAAPSIGSVPEPKLVDQHERVAASTGEGSPRDSSGAH